MFFGCSSVHAGDCYRMFDPDTKIIHISRDIRWLNKMYYNTKDAAMEKKVKSKNLLVNVKILWMVTILSPPVTKESNNCTRSCPCK